jgi:hypothetical protein
MQPRNTQNSQRSSQIHTSYSGSEDVGKFVAKAANARDLASVLSAIGTKNENQARFHFYHIFQSF